MFSSENHFLLNFGMRNIYNGIFSACSNFFDMTNGQQEDCREFLF